MILGFKQKFPNGESTMFKELILMGNKIHSIRSGNRWRAGMAIHMAYGVRTKNYEQFNKDIPPLQKCISVQDVHIRFRNGFLSISVDGRELNPFYRQRVIRHDGLTRDEFINWFLPDIESSFTGQIIHWTHFKY